MKHLRFRINMVSLWRFRFAMEFTTALWGGESKSERTEFWHLFKLDFTKERSGFYMLTLVLLPIAVWVGYRGPVREQLQGDTNE